MRNFSNLVYPDISYRLNGVLFEVHNELGRYHNEKQYCDRIEKKLKKDNWKIEREKVLPSSFKGEIKGRNRLDFLVEDKIILEIKAKRRIQRQDYYQLMRYLEALEKKLGLLANFRSKHLHPKRVLNPKVKP